MALKLLQPGLRPLGQFDLEDSHTVYGGEALKLQNNQNADLAAADADVLTASLDPTADIYIGTAFAGNTLFAASTSLEERGSGPFDGSNRQVNLARFDGGLLSNPQLVVLGDEGQAEYGTLFGTAIGGTAGQGTTTGPVFGTANGATSSLGPNTAFASGKVTGWHAPGLYGLSEDVFADNGSVGTATESIAPNTLLGPTNSTATSQTQTAGSTDNGKWAMEQTNGGSAHTSTTGCALMIGKQYDSSLVSTTSLAVGGSAEVQCYAVYFLGVSQ